MNTKHMLFKKSKSNEKSSSLIPASQPIGSVTTLQRKLTIGAKNGPLEDQADAKTDTVMRMPESSILQRKCEECEKEKNAQRKILSSGKIPFIQAKQSGEGIASDAVASKIQSTKGGGHP